MNQAKSFNTDSPLLFKPIRSFVHRQAGLSKTRRHALDTLLNDYGLSAKKTFLNLEHIFCRAAPTTLEIGFGMGHHLLEQAQRYPEQNFLGIEVHRPGIAAVLLDIEALKLSNLKIFDADAMEILTHCIADKSLQTIQIFFPDPWPKKRHHKRRFIQIPSAQLLQKKLIVGGELQLATDWQDYAEHMLKVLENTVGLKNRAQKNQFSPRLSQRALTKFEKRGQQLGHRIWDLIFYAIA